MGIRCSSCAAVDTATNPSATPSDNDAARDNVPSSHNRAIAVPSDNTNAQDSERDVAPLSDTQADPLLSLQNVAATNATSHAVPHEVHQRSPPTPSRILPPPLSSFQPLPPSSPSCPQAAGARQQRMNGTDDFFSEGSMSSPLALDSPKTPIGGPPRGQNAKPRPHRQQPRPPSCASFTTVLDDASRDVAEESFRRFQHQQASSLCSQAHRSSTSVTASSVSTTESLSNVDLSNHDSARKTLFAALSDRTAEQHARQAARETKSNNNANNHDVVAPTKECRIPSSFGSLREKGEATATSTDTEADVMGPSLSGNLRDVLLSSNHFGEVVEEVDEDA